MRTDRVEKVFRENREVIIKNPYLVFSQKDVTHLRIDYPENLIFVDKDLIEP